MLKDLTKQYIEAFNSKDINAVSVLLDKDFILCDPVVKRLEGKEKCLEAIKNIFDSCETLNFRANNIYRDSQTTFIEFILELDGVKLEGVDIIEWRDKKMVELRAYLDTKGSR